MSERISKNVVDMNGKPRILQIPCTGNWGLRIDDLAQILYGKTIQLKTASDVPVEVFFTEDYISIIDNSFKCKLIAGVGSNRVLGLTIKTRYSQFGMKKPHPDFYAAKFVTFALQYFEENGVRIDACCGTWEPWSDNFKQFSKVYKPRQDNRIEAANSTWSAQQFRYHGFKLNEKSDVTFHADSKNYSDRWEDVEQIQAMFRR